MIRRPPRTSTIIQNVPPRWRLPLRVLEQTGLRVGVDMGATSGQAWKDRRGTQVGRDARLVNGRGCGDLPAEDRTPERQTFAGFTGDSAKSVMARRASTPGSFIGIHMISVTATPAFRSAEGVPVTQVAAQLGHSKKSLALDTYSHVVVDG